MIERQIIKQLIDENKYSRANVAKICGLTVGRIGQIYRSTDEKPAGCNSQAAFKLVDFMKKQKNKPKASNE